MILKESPVASLTSRDIRRVDEHQRRWRMTAAHANNLRDTPSILGIPRNVLGAVTYHREHDKLRVSTSWIGELGYGRVRSQAEAFE